MDKFRFSSSEKNLVQRRLARGDEKRHELTLFAGRAKSNIQSEGFS